MTKKIINMDRKIIEQWCDLFAEMMGISLSFDEVEKSISYIKENKQRIISKINEL